MVIQLHPQYFPGDIVVVLLAKLDALAECGTNLVLKTKVGGEHIRHRSTHVQIIRTHTRRAFEHQNAAHQGVSVLRLFFHFVVDTLVELGKAPVFVHTRMDEILVTSCQFARQQRVEVIDYVGVTLHRPTSPCLKVCSLNHDDPEVTGPTAEK